MFNDNELGLLKDTLQKCGLGFALLSPDNPFCNIADEFSHPAFELLFSSRLTLDSLLGGVKPKTLYSFKDSFSLCYSAFLLPKATGKVVAVLGPFLSERIRENEILEICEQNGFEPKNQKIINEFFMSLPVLSAGSQVHILVDSFCERMWDGPYEVFDLAGDSFDRSAITEISEKGLDDTFIDMKNMERRYAFENELMDAVALGSESKLRRIFSSAKDSFFEKRTADPIRNAKNYTIIMNTLLRKAAERGGVHPMYLNRISSDFAIKIESFSSLEQASALIKEMYTDYCKLVKNHSTASLSPIVKAAVTAIDSDPSSELGLKSLSMQLNVSSVYLSTLFKKETGKTLTEYINDRRISHAKHLLKTTSLQIQTVSLHCGMADVQYFSKLFKKKTGKTPSQYRKTVVSGS